MMGFLWPRSRIPLWSNSLKISIFGSTAPHSLSACLPSARDRSRTFGSMSGKMISALSGPLKVTGTHLWSRPSEGKMWSGCCLSSILVEGLGSACLHLWSLLFSSLSCCGWSWIAFRSADPWLQSAGSGKPTSSLLVPRVLLSQYLASKLPLSKQPPGNYWANRCVWHWWPCFWSCRIVKPWCQGWVLCFWGWRYRWGRIVFSGRLKGLGCRLFQRRICRRYGKEYEPPSCTLIATSTG